MSHNFFYAGEVGKAGIEVYSFLNIELKIAYRAHPIDAQTVP